MFSHQKNKTAFSGLTPTDTTLFLTFLLKQNLKVVHRAGSNLHPPILFLRPLQPSSHPSLLLKPLLSRSKTISTVPDSKSCLWFDFRTQLIIASFLNDFLHLPSRIPLFLRFILNTPALSFSFLFLISKNIKKATPKFAW